LSDFNVWPKETTVYGSGFDLETNYSRLGAYLTHLFTADLNQELAVAKLRTLAEAPRSICASASLRKVKNLGRPRAGRPGHRVPSRPQAGWPGGSWSGAEVVSGFG
jgi:hypothetical protein